MSNRQYLIVSGDGKRVGILRDGSPRWYSATELLEICQRLVIQLRMYREALDYLEALQQGRMCVRVDPTRAYHTVRIWNGQRWIKVRSDD